LYPYPILLSGHADLPDSYAGNLRRNLGGFLSAVDDDAKNSYGQQARNNSNDDRCIHVHFSFPVYTGLPDGAYINQD
jgi:hypothetical protein